KEKSERLDQCVECGSIRRWVPACNWIEVARAEQSSWWCEKLCGDRAQAELRRRTIGVQRRAKRVRCNDGLGGICPSRDSRTDCCWPELGSPGLGLADETLVFVVA